MGFNAAHVSTGSEHGVPCVTGTFVELVSCGAQLFPLRKSDSCDHVDKSAVLIFIPSQRQREDYSTIHQALLLMLKGICEAVRRCSHVTLLMKAFLYLSLLCMPQELAGSSGCAKSFCQPSCFAPGFHGEGPSSAVEHILCM